MTTPSAKKGISRQHSGSEVSQTRPPLADDRGFGVPPGSGDDDRGATGDQEIDTAGTEADASGAIDAQKPASMPRAEDDERTRAHSPDFHDRPGSGKHITPRP
jgi:hypothetical protein